MIGQFLRRKNANRQVFVVFCLEFIIGLFFPDMLTQIECVKCGSSAIYHSLSRQEDVIWVITLVNDYEWE